jgi:hypothetical protein
MPKLQPKEKTLQDALYLKEELSRDGIFRTRDDLIWRISPEPFWLTPEEMTFIKDLGRHLLGFYQSLNRLYFESVKGRQPGWVARYLDLGKSEEVVNYGRMNRFKQDLPRIIRPDLIPTDQGLKATELDSVPGGMGLTANLASRYEALGFSTVGGSDGLIQGFAAMIREAAGGSQTPSLVVIVSEESASYRPEMRWLGDRLNEMGLPTSVVNPGEIRFTEDGLTVRKDREIPVDVIYRFFELFDLKNIPKSELILYSIRKGHTKITPPPKAFLEEKMAFGLFHHPVLAPFWHSELGEESFDLLKRLFPPTWILDPQPIPPHAVVPGLAIGNRPVTDWRALTNASQKEREMILKPSGFSELAWGSRGVVAGHDLPQREWAEAVENALSSFGYSPYILQPFYHGKKHEMTYLNEDSLSLQSMTGRVRLSPYYYVHNGQAELGGILATLCPLDKKLIHGMTDAVMAPCAVRSDV